MPPRLASLSRRWTLVLLLALGLGAQAQTTPPPPPAAEPPLFAIQVRKGASWDEAKPPQAQAQFREHSAHLKRLRDAGSLVMGARYSDVGLLVVTAENEAAARALMDGDPSVAAGTFSIEVHPFNVFYGGSLQPPPATPVTDGPLRAWQVLLGGISALVLTIGLARFAYTPLLPQMHAQAGLGVADGGLLASINYAGYMSGALLAAWIESPVWRQRLYVWALPLALVITALMSWSTSFSVWALSRYVGGLCGAAGMLLGSGLVQGWLIRSGRRPELGIYFIGLGLGIVVSALGAMGMTQLDLGWAAQWQGFALLGLAFLVPAWLWRPPVPPPAAKATVGAAPSRRWMALMVAAYFCAGWGFVINATFTVAIVEKQPLLAGQGPWAWLLVGLASTPAVFLWDRVARRTGDVGALLIAFGLQVVGVLLPVLASGLVAALLGALLYGATFIGIVSLTLALVGRRSPANPGKAMARLTLSYGVAQISAPALTGRMVEASGSFDAALWLTAAVLAVGMACLAALRSQPG